MRFTCVQDATRYDPLDMHDWQQEQHQHEQHNQHNQHPPQQQPENSWASPYPSVEAFFTHSRASLPYQQHRSASGSSSRHAFAQHQQFGAPSSSTVLQDLTSGGLPSVRDSSSHDSGSGHEMRNSHSHSQVRVHNKPPCRLHVSEVQHGALMHWLQC